MKNYGKKLPDVVVVVKLFNSEDPSFPENDDEAIPNTSPFSLNPVDVEGWE